MIPMDLRTAGLLTASATLGYAAILAVIWTTDRRQRELAVLAIAFALMAVGTGAISFRHIAPDIVSVVGGNAVILVGATTLWRGSRVLAGRPPKPLVELGLLALAITAIAYFAYVDKNVNARIIAFSLMSSTISILVFLEFARRPGAAFRGPDWLLMGCFLALGLMFLARSVFAFHEDLLFGHGDNYASRGTILVVPMACYVGTALGILWMTFDRIAGELRSRGTALADAEQSLRRLIEGVSDYAIFMLDAEGRVKSWNVGAEKIFGYRLDEIVGQNYARFCTDEDRTAGQPAAALAQAAQSGRFEAHGQRVRNDGSGFWANVVLTAVFDDAGTLVGFSNITRDVSEQHAARLAIDEARNAAVQANQAKSTFLANMSHEIRTPMNGIIGFTDILLEISPRKEQQLYLGMLRDAGELLLTIIDDILDFSKVEAGKLTLERVPVNLPSTIQGAVELVRLQASAKGLDVGVDIDAELPNWLTGDPTRLRQILLNLLSNAVKFTDRGKVSLTARRHVEGETPYIAFDVVDTGIGIPADRQDLLFQDFSQVHRLAERRPGGTGLGLAICKKLVAAMGGAIGVVSRAGEGSRFWFKIPLEAQEAPATDTLAGVDHAVTGGVRILVAEDVQVSQIIIERLLTMAGHQVTVVGDGAEALAALQTRDYDLVLMDVEMPRMDGLATTRAVRQLAEPVGSIPIVGLTANAMAHDIELCREAGMNAHLRKPIDRRTLLATIATWCRTDPALRNRAG